MHLCRRGGTRLPQRSVGPGPGAGQGPRPGRHGGIGIQIFLSPIKRRKVPPPRAIELQPITPGIFGYSVLRNSTWADLFGDLFKMCTDMDFPLEGLHTETGPGVLEASLDKDLALAATISSGLWGLEQSLEPTAPVRGNAYDQSHPKRLSLPRALDEAAERLQRSKAARNLFGQAFVEHFTASGDWKERQSRRAVTDWQLQRYFKII